MGEMDGESVSEAFKKSVIKQYAGTRLGHQEIAAETVSYMTFSPAPSGGKTMAWWVHDRHGGLLGKVRWFGRWRQYTFVSEQGTVLSAGCLDDLAQFLRAHRDDRNEGA